MLGRYPAPTSFVRGKGTVRKTCRNNQIATTHFLDVSRGTTHSRLLFRLPDFRIFFLGLLLHDRKRSFHWIQNQAEGVMGPEMADQASHRLVVGPGWKPPGLIPHGVPAPLLAPPNHRAPQGPTNPAKRLRNGVGKGQFKGSSRSRGDPSLPKFRASPTIRQVCQPP